MKHSTCNMKQETQKNKCSICDKRYVISDRGGFSFMEVMISVFLLSIGMVASITLISGGLKESIDSRNQLIASLLSQEGVELVRNIRDNNWADGAPATSFSNMPTGNSNDNCRINYSSTAFGNGDCNISIDKTLLYDGIFYNTLAGTPTKFKRKISISYNPNFAAAENATIISMVIWKNTSFPANTALCTTSAGCAYAEAILTKWNE